VTDLSDLRGADLCLLHKLTKRTIGKLRSSRATRDYRGTRADKGNERSPLRGFTNTFRYWQNW